jgi:hypothetical protein
MELWWSGVDGRRLPPGGLQGRAATTEQRTTIKMGMKTIRLTATSLGKKTEQRMLVEPMPSSKIGHLWSSDAEFSHPLPTVEALVKGLQSNTGCCLSLPTPSSRSSKLLLIDRPTPSYRSISYTYYTVARTYTLRYMLGRGARVVYLWAGWLCEPEGQPKSISEGYSRRARWISWNRARRQATAGPKTTSTGIQRKRHVCTSVFTQATAGSK